MHNRKNEKQKHKKQTKKHFDFKIFKLLLFKRK